MPIRLKKRPPTFLHVKRKATMLAWDIVPIAITWLHVFLSPYTKVEESFTLHAVHDILAHGLWPSELSKWDHVTFPGAVPRSFLPPLILSAVAFPIVKLALFLDILRNKMDIQIIIRIVLATIFSVCFAQLAKSLRYRYGAGVRIWFIILSLTGFHIPYYAGRTLPNFMALPGAIAWIIRSGASSIPTQIRRKRVRMAITLLTFLATNVRLELAAFLLPMTLGLVFSGTISLGNAMLSGAVGGFGALIIASPIDYRLWSLALPHPSLPTFSSAWQWALPELSSLHYNILEGQSANWGIMSKHYYLTNSLPKLLMASLPLSLLGLIWAGTNKAGHGPSMGGSGRGVLEIIGRTGLGMGVVGLIGGLSAVGHKEWRFVVYAVPVFNILAALTASALWSSSPPRIRPLIRLGLVGMVSLQVIATGFLTFISMNNYPGGEVWKALDQLHGNTSKPVTVHYSSYPLQTGSSLFTFGHDHTFPLPSPERKDTPGWTYSKAEDPTLLTPSGAMEAGFDYVVLESGTERDWIGQGEWMVKKEIEGLKGVRRGGKWGVRVIWDRRVVILGKKAEDGMDLGKWGGASSID